MRKTSAPGGASTAMVDVPPLAGAFANVTAPGAAASGFTSTMTLAVDGDTNAGRRRRPFTFAARCDGPAFAVRAALVAFVARSGQCIVKLTGTRAAAFMVRVAGSEREAPPEHPLVAAANAKAAASARARMRACGVEMKRALNGCSLA